MTRRVSVPVRTPTSSSPPARSSRRTRGVGGVGDGLLEAVEVGEFGLDLGDSGALLGDFKVAAVLDSGEQFGVDVVAGCVPGERQIPPPSAIVGEACPGFGELLLGCCEPGFGVLRGMVGLLLGGGAEPSVDVGGSEAEQPAARGEADGGQDACSDGAADGVLVDLGASGYAPYCQHSAGGMRRHNWTIPLS